MDIIKILIEVGALITALGVMYEAYKKATLAMLDDKFQQINTRLDEVEDKIDDSDLQACKNFLVHALNDIERGVADEVTIERVYEQHEYYHMKGGNSYIDARFDRLKAEGKI